MNNYIPTWTTQHIYLSGFVTSLLRHLNDSVRSRGTERNNVANMQPLEIVTVLYHKTPLGAAVGCWDGPIALEPEL